MTQLERVLKEEIVESGLTDGPACTACRFRVKLRTCIVPERDHGDRNFGVHVSLNGQDMGVTNRAGYLVVPDAVPYYDNRIRIDERATSFDTVISDGNQDIAPGIRSGALVKYGVRTIVAFTGKVLVRKNGANVVPAAGDFTLSHASKSFASDLGDDGEFYFENLTAGDYAAVVRYAGGSCKLNVTIKAGSKLINDVGTLICDVEH